MISLPSEEVSFWLSADSQSHYPQLKRDLTVDVVIVGAGITGLTTAYLLKQAGLTVAVLEKDVVGAGVTGHTTGKVTSQHNLIYDKLQRQSGAKTARVYGEANQAALDQTAAIITKEHIDCNWERDDNYVYTTEASQVDSLKQEAKVAQACGLPATFETKTSLPFEVKGAVRFANQAKFHARSYLLGLAKVVNGGGSHVFEHSRMLGTRDGETVRVTTKHGTIRAKHAVIATNVPSLPLMARGGYCILEYPRRSYIVAGRVDHEVKGMYISPDENQYSILPIESGAQRWLLVGGEGHITRPGMNAPARYQKLADYAQKHFGVASIEYRWTAMDYLAYDDMPLIGKLYPWSKHVYVGTAFMKWGLTNGVVAAMILSDAIQGKLNPWAATFDSMRLKPITSIPKVFVETVKG